MSYVSPRSLQLLHDIVSEGDDNDYEDLYVEPTQQSEADNNRGIENMNGEEQQDFKENLNFFEKLEQENGSSGQNGNVLVNGFMNGHVENGVQEETLQGIAEESEEDSYTVTEDISVTTADTSTLDIDTSSSTLISKKSGRTRRINNLKADHNHNYRKPTKTSSVRDNSTDRDSMSDQVETMSDSGRIGRHQRKLNKRSQYREFRPIGMEPLETAEERLEKKYEELEHLLAGQFVEQKKALGINHLQQMELLRQQYSIASHGLPPSGVLIPRSLPSQHRNNIYHRQTGRDKENHGHPPSEDEAYGTIRTLQASKVSQRKSRARSARTRPLSATRQNQSRSTSRDRRDQTPDKKESSGEKVQRSKARSRSNSGSRSSSRSPRRPATETHLKNTDNDLVRDWIKKKDMEYRRQKAEERKKKRLERKEKIERRLEREERYKDSHMVVNAWMKQKQREAYRRQRQERQQLKEELKLKEQNRVHNVSVIHGWGVDRPVSAPGPISTDRNKIRVQRPGTTVSEMRENEENKRLRQAATENGDTSVHQEIPQPPMTKYVYRRPVLGKVRLRNKQPQEESKPAPVKKQVEKPLSKEEIERRQRVSYDDWLQQKRKEDAEKKKELQKQKQLSQSTPEYETPVPELVQNGEKNVLQGKRIPGSSARSSARPAYVSKIISQEERERIREMAQIRKQSSLSVQEEIDTSYDERSESPEEAIQRVAKNVVNYVLKSLSDEEGEDELFEDTDEVEHEGLANLSILGSKASLSSKTRPMSASAVRVPAPQSSKSPRRPVSAQPKQKQPSREAIQGSIPFPSDVGAPPHVMHVQKKLFSNRIWVNAEDARPDPQGSGASNKEEVEEHSSVQVLEQDTQKGDTENGKKGEEKEEETVSEEKEQIAEEEKDMSEEEDNRNLESVMSSKKHVSFCEEAIVFDDSENVFEVYEELEAWEDAAGDDDLDVEKIRKLFIESSLALEQAQQDQQGETSEEAGGVFLTSSPEDQNKEETSV